MYKSFEDQIRDKYFTWLYGYVCKGRAHNNTSYIKLFMFLHDVEFTSSIRMDMNRAQDGIDLRYRFAMTYEDYTDEIENIIDILNGPCSVLEMMIALAIRCEETIMDDTRYGDRTSQWFWSMMNNLGIGNMFDERFDRRIAEEKVRRFLNRDYAPDGKGGLFYIQGCQDDLRNEEIWTQLCWYLDKFD